MLKIFTRTVCPKCMLLKTELERRGMEFEAVNIDIDAEAKVEIVGQGFMGVPVVKFEDSTYVQGFTEVMERIDS